MKRIITSILFLLVVLCSYAQTKRFYCELKGMDNSIGTGLDIIIDFGERRCHSVSGELTSNLHIVNEENGDIIKFNSMVDAANYITERGWQFQQAYSSTYQKNSVTNWIFYKDAESLEEAKLGITTREEYKAAHKKKKK